MVCDESAGVQKVVLKRTLSASPSAVFAAWTQPEQMRQWFMPGNTFTNPIMEVDLRVGGAYRIGFQSPDGNVSVVGGTYQVIQPPHKLVFTWAWHPPHETSVWEHLTTRVTLDFSACAVGTELTLTHEKLMDAEMVEKHTAGWSGALDLLVKKFANP